jgi:hypothetical protein
MALLRRALLPVLVALVTAPAATAAFSFTTAPATATAGVTLNGDDQTVTFPVTITTTNTPGTTGFYIDGAATQLTQVTPAQTLPATALQVTNVASTAACGGGGCTLPTNNVTYAPIVLTTTAQRIYRAVSPTGKGTNTLTATFAVVFPANALVGTAYTSTITITGSTGP